VNEVTFTNFRGIDKLSIPLAQAMMLTGPNGVGKTSILEGLYCLFSETRLNIIYLSRYNRRICMSSDPYGASAGGDPYRFNYGQFWNECPKYGNSSCSVTAQLNGRCWDWSYRKAQNFSELPPELASALNMPGWTIDALTEFAVWDWSIDGEERHSRGQSLSTMMPGFHIFPPENKSHSFCKYIDFATIRAAPAKLTFKVSKLLTEALQLINSHVTDIRFEGADSGLSAILDDEHSTSLDTLGNGAVSLVNVLIAIFETLEIQSRTQPEAPFFVLIDEIGAAMHYNVLLDVWKYLRTLSEKHSNLHYVTTSHSNDCIAAFCEVFKDKMDNNEAKLLRLHKGETEIKVTEELNR